MPLSLPCMDWEELQAHPKVWVMALGQQNQSLGQCKAHESRQQFSFLYKFPGCTVKENYVNITRYCSKFL